MQGVKSITFYESADTVSGVFDYQSGSRFYKVQEGALFEKYRSWFQSGRISAKELAPNGEISTGPFSRGAIVEFRLQEQEKSCPYKPVVVLRLDEQGIEPYNACLLYTSTNRIEMLSARSAALSSENPARARLSKLFDADSFVELDAFVKAGENEAGVVAGYGLVEGSVVYAFSQDVSSDSGAVSAAHAKKVKKVYELAAKTGCPVVCIYDSKGAKLSEGNEMLAAYSDMLASSGKISGVVPQIAVVLGTCAGVSAMLAAAADVLVISRDAQLFKMCIRDSR